MSEYFKLLCLALATWRVSSFLVQEAGPGDIFAQMRYRLGVRFDERSQPYGTSVLSSLFTCIWCMSVWVAFCFTCFPLLVERMGRKWSGLFYVIVQALTLSSIAIWFNRQTGTK